MNKEKGKYINNNSIRRQKQTIEYNSYESTKK